MFKSPSCDPYRRAFAYDNRLKGTLVEEKFSRLESDSNIHDANNPVVSVDDPDHVEEIINKINSSNRKSAAKIVFEKGPEGLITFSNSVSDVPAVEMPYFPESGDVLYKGYIIDSDLNPLLVK